MIKNIFNISDLTNIQLNKIINSELKYNSLSGKNIGMIFEKYSTRTRLSFAVAISNLGANKIDIRFEELNISREETFEDTFRAMNCYLDGLIYRTNDHQKLLNAAKYFQKPIINALSDISHPCQIISDLFTLKENFGNLELNILWMGDLNNVCFSLYEAAKLFPQINLNICAPIDIISKKKWEKFSNINFFSDLNEVSLSMIDCVMTDVFISMNDNPNDDKLNKLKHYKVTNEIMKRTKNESVFMHCLPAKVDFEVSDEVINGPRSIVWKQAKNRMVSQMRLMQCLNWQ